MIPPTKLRNLFSNKFLIDRSTIPPLRKLCFPLNHKHQSLAFQGGGWRFIPAYLTWDLCGENHAVTGFSLGTGFPLPFIIPPVFRVYVFQYL
jgi:hypothetical protein